MGDTVASVLENCKCKFKCSTTKKSENWKCDAAENIFVCHVSLTSETVKVTIIITEGK